MFHPSFHRLSQVAEIEKQLEAKEVLLLQRRLEKLGQGNDWKMKGKTYWEKYVERVQIFLHTSNFLTYLYI